MTPFPDRLQSLAALPAMLREEIRPLLPDGAFLRRANGDWLFITDAPRRSVETLPAMDEKCLETSVQSGLLLLRPCAAFLAGLESAFPDPPDFFSASLHRLRGLPVAPDAPGVFAAGLKLIDHPDAQPMRIWLKRTRNLAALCLRRQEGGAYACALVACLLKSYDFERRRFL